MSDSDQFSTDEEPIQEAMAIESDDDDDSPEVEAAQVLESVVEGTSAEQTSDPVQAHVLPASRHLSYDEDEESADHAAARQANHVHDEVPSRSPNAEAEYTKSFESKDNVEDSADDEEEDGVTAAVVLEDEADEDGEVAQAEVVEAAEVENDHAIAVALDEEEGISESKKKKVRKMKKGKKKSSKRSRAHQEHWGGIPPERLDAAADAREVLLDSVSRLPFAASDSHTVRSFGRLQVQDSLESPFCSASALFPVGFSCDRYEFSPVHGRVIKLRCTILDGSKFPDHKGTSGGPIFRVMWGHGVDSDMDTMDYPYDPYTASAPIAGGGQVDAVALPFSDNASSSAVLPEVGMRVKVRFEADKWYGGTLVHVGDEENDKKTKRKRVEICIQYDDGSTEDAIFPDPDIKLNLPGDEDDKVENGMPDLTEVNGKPVTSVSGGTPLEAWGKALVKLGLIDEIIEKSAIEALTTSREEGRAEAMGKIQAQKLQRQQARLKSQQKQSGEEETDEKADQAASESSPKSQASEMALSPVPSSVAEEGDSNAEKNEGVKQELQENDVEQEEQQKEAATDEELELRSRVKVLTEELDWLRDQDREALIGLTDARISNLGPFLFNPFHENDPDYAQQSSWLATVIRKEKAKMGSTGNRKKVVTRTDLLERNDTFYNGEIERLLEGLPGSEYCPSYVFQEFRSGGAAVLSQAWVHEAEIRQEKMREKQLRSVREAKVKASQQRERDEKKRKREEVRDARKRQKMEEMEQKKQARVEERLSRLTVQLDERLVKEACFQREKVILLISKAFGKEFVRRRKAAELVSGNLILNTRMNGKIQSEQSIEAAATIPGELPPLSRVYDEEVLRVWDFVTSFGSAFINLGFMSSLPSLDALQSAIDSIRAKGGLSEESQSKVSRTEAVDSLTDLAIALSKPLAASLTKLLFASLIALNPALQKDYGASFFAELNATSKESSTSKEEGGGPSLPGLLPVNKLTWQEVARASFLSDGLGELGYSRHEAAHLLRGYRSGGHPNSKEAKRLRRAEEFSIALLRQIISQGGLESQSMIGDEKNGKNGFNILLYVPCKPSATSSDWTFYLHNVKALPNTAIPAIKSNISKALSMLTSSASDLGGLDSVVSDLNKCITMCDKAGASEKLGASDLSSCTKAKLIVLRVLDRVTGERYSTDVVGRVLFRDDVKTQRQKSENLADLSNPSDASFRHRMGQLDSLVMTSQQYKDLVHAREEYMADALRLKEDMERKQKKAEGEEDDDDDDEDEEEDDNEKGDGIEKAKLADKVPAKESSGVDTATAEIEQTEQDRKPASTEEKVSNKDTEEVAVDEGQGKSVNSQTSSEQELVPEPATEIVATVVENGEHTPAASAAADPRKVGKATQFDEFCGDMPDAHELIRRCLAVLRTLCQTGPAEPFVYPVDPQSNPGYYESILRPMCLREVGLILQRAGKLSAESIQGSEFDHDVVEGVVAEFGRNVRLINQNCSCYSNVGASIISSAEEMLRIFERLFLDWVLVPGHLLPPLEVLDDDRCVEYHPSDEDSLVLLCDGCEGKYNMSRLDPPLLEVPKGDWFCPRCLSGRCFEDLDPRIGREVRRRSLCGKEGAGEKKRDAASNGVIRKCSFRYAEAPGGRASLTYVIRYKDDTEETWTLEEVDKALAESGKPAPPIRCLEAVAESPGYGRGTDHGLHADLVPVPLNPGVSDAAAQAALSSSVFRDTIAGSSSLLLISPDEMSSSEWLRLLILLVMKCSSSEMMVGLASKMESHAAEELSQRLSAEMDASETLSYVTDDDAEEADDLSQNSLSDDEEEWTDKHEKNGDRNGYADNTTLAEAMDSSAMVVEAKIVEVVAEEDVTQIPGTSDVIATPSAVVTNEDVKVSEGTTVNKEDPKKKKRALALGEKEKRQKAREDSIAAYCIKNQLRSTVASFEEDTVSQVVDSTLMATDPGLNFQASRCRGILCHFCGLSDISLGTPLLRVPDDAQWSLFTPHALRLRRIQLVADVSSRRSSDEIQCDGGSRETLSSLLSPSRARRQKKLVTVAIRVGGELFSKKEDSTFFDDTVDGGMLEFLPRNEDGFQKELLCRYDAGLPFVSGSLSAHECCAIAAHNGRKEQAAQVYREKHAILADKDCGSTCGRTLSLGSDDAGRSYWKFHSDPSSLFVYGSDALAIDAASKKWHRFSEPEAIASVIVSLGKQEVVRELKRSFPKPAHLLRTGKWAELLQKRAFPLCSALSDASPPSKQTSVDEPAVNSKDSSSSLPLPEEANEEDEPYVEGEHVLVESASGKLLWDATVVAVSRSKTLNKVNGYRVHYKEWSSRFDEWVEPLRVVEPSENNLQVQEELLEELLSSKDDVPESLEGMKARTFLHKKDRSRGPAELPDFMAVARVGPGTTSDDSALATLKAALLLIEAALPIGAIDASESGPWRPDVSMQWRSIVQNAGGPSSLMRCMILMEDALSPEWLDEKIGHLLSCMPIRWKAVGEASVSSLALRIFLIDRGIKYGTVEKRKRKK